jgi:hypothetical protein
MNISFRKEFDTDIPTSWKPAYIVGFHRAAEYSHRIAVQATVKPDMVWGVYMRTTMIEDRVVSSIPKPLRQKAPAPS